MAVLIAKPPISISTKYVYTHLKLDSLEHPDMDKVLTAYKAGDIETVAKSMGNVLESVSEKENEIISKLKASMLEEGAVGSLMSGSGPTVFGLFENIDKAAKAGQNMKANYPDVFIQAVNLIK
jgi:4-diphosphocytidyl-2-C-methyl-D-erythritol kinase